jgi:DNA polymerase-3 subunit delta
MTAKKRETVSAQGFEQLEKDLKAGTLGRVYVFYGEESYLLHQYLDMVRAALIPAGFGEFNDHHLTGKELTVQAIAEAVDAMPMMAEHTLVTVTDWDLFKQDEASRAALVSLLSDVPDYCTLLFIYDTLPYKKDAKQKKLTAALNEYCCEVAFQEQKKDKLYKWIARHFAANGHTIDVPAMDLLVFTCGSLMAGLSHEIEKISAYAKGERVTADDIRAVAEPVLDARVFDLTDRITARDYDSAAKLLGELLQMQEEPIMILAVIGKTLRQIYTARVALDSGRDRFWVQQLWHTTSDYPPKLWMASARKVSHAWCSSAVKGCQVLDRRMKSEKGVDGEKEIKLFLLSLTQEV